MQDARALRAPERPVAPGGTSPRTGGVSADVDPKARAIFDGCWTRLERKLGFAALQAPRELVLLNGAPGSGKSVSTPFICRSRNLSRSLCVSALLSNDSAVAALVAAGELVSDASAVDALLLALFDAGRGADPAGCVVDGFPRTPLQVDLLCLLADKLSELHLANAEHPVIAQRWPRCRFRIVILFVDEHTSLRRQMERGSTAIRLRERALAAGMPHMAAQARSTDASEAIARHRYAVFKKHYSTLLRLKERFPFTLIDAHGSVSDTEAQIGRELRYQSSMELSERAYNAIRQIPLASDLVSDARVQLVARLDVAARRHASVFADVVALVETDVLPVLRRAALAGRAVFESNAAALASPLAPEVLVDVLSDRGFAVQHTLRTQHVPVRVDTATGAVECLSEQTHVFTINFERALLRRSARTAPLSASGLLALSSEQPAVERTAKQHLAAAFDMTAPPPRRTGELNGEVAAWDDVSDVVVSSGSSGA